MEPLFLGYVSLTAALVITPGSTTAVVVRNTLASGCRGGVFAALGAAVGNTIHAATAGLGLAAVVARLPLILILVKIGGGLYLVALGLASLRRVGTGAALPISNVILSDVDRRAHHHALREGATVNLLNPAIATFYLAVVPSFLPAAAPRGYYVELTAIHVGMALICHTVWAFGMDRLRHLLEDERARQALEALTAAALLLLALRVLLSIQAS